MKINHGRRKDFGTAAVADFVKSRGVKMSAISENTGISYDKIRRSFTSTRPLTADEFLLICEYLGVDPIKFRSETRTES